MSAIALKVLACLIGGALSAALLRPAQLKELSDRRFTTYVLATHVGFAGLLFLAYYIVGNQPVTSDVPGYYVPAAHAVVAGLLPYKDFPMSYAPLFPYIGAVFLSLWDSPKIFPLVSIALSAITLFLWNGIAAQSYDRRLVRMSSVMYATSGHVLLQCLLGTNQIWVALGLALSARLTVRERAFASGIVQGLSIATSKIIGMLFWPALWIATSRRLRWTVGTIGVCAAIYGFFVVKGADVLYPLRAEGMLISSGNLPYVIEPMFALFGVRVNRIVDLTTITLMGSILLTIYLRAPRTRKGRAAKFLVPALAISNLMLMLLSKKSFTGYCVFAIYPMYIVLVSSLSYVKKGTVPLIAFGTAFNVLLAIEPSLWFHLGGNGLLLSTWFESAALSTTVPFLLIETLLLTTYAWLFWRAIKLLPRWTGEEGLLVTSA